MFGSGVLALILENKNASEQILCRRVHRVECASVSFACGTSHQVSSSLTSIILQQSVCFPPSSFRKHRRGCVRAGEGQRVEPGSHSGGIFGVSWHLGERFQLVRDPCVHFDGFAGEQQPDIIVQVDLPRFGALESAKDKTKNMCCKVERSGENGKGIIHLQICNNVPLFILAGLTLQGLMLKSDSLPASAHIYFYLFICF